MSGPKYRPFFTMMLINIVEVSNVFSVLIVLLFFCVMVVFIFRLQGEGIAMTSVQYATRVPTGPLPVIKIFNPFAFSLQTHDCAMDDVVCVVSSQVPWALMPLWGVDVARMHQAVAAGRPWNAMRDELLEDDYEKMFLGAWCRCRGNLKRYSKCADLELHLSPSVIVDPNDLGRPPRDRYPLVIVLVNLSENEGEDKRVGAMIIVIHIKDNICTGASCVVAQLLKMTNGQLSDLKPLYVPDDDDDDNDHKDIPDLQSDATQFTSSTGALCLICRMLPASRALLPCRHVCSCSRCFQHLDKCPMCRSHIQTYFCIRDETATVDDQQDTLSEGDGMEPENWNRRLLRWNEWLNRTLGFT